MGSLPTCWYCPECGNVSNIKPPGAHLNARTWLQCSDVHVESLVFPPDSPLSVILDTLGRTYRRGGMKDFGDGTFEVDEIESSNRVPVLVVDNPATEEAHGVPPAPLPSQLISCAMCFGDGRVPGAAIGGFVACPGCQGAGVKRV